MKVALVLEDFAPATGGLATWTVQLARHLVGRGHDVHVVAFAGDAAAAAVTLHLVSDAGSIFVRCRRIAAAVAALGADVVHDTGLSWSGDVFQPQTGSRLIAYRRELQGLPPWPRMKRLLHPRQLWWQLCLHRLERRQVRAARRIVAVSAMVARTLHARHAIAPDALRVIHNGVDIGRFSPTTVAARRPRARAALGVAEEVLFVVVAHNFRLKNLDTVLRAFALLPAGDAALLAVAGGAPDAFWTGTVAALGLTGKVRFCSNLPDVVELLAAADCLLHPTRWDACSLATLEAMACGRAVITTVANGAAEAIEDGVSGFVLPHPSDAGALAARMRAMLDPARREAVAQAGRRAALHFDSTKQFAAVEAVLAEAARAP